MAFPVDLRRCQALGLAGTAFLAAGGETAGALPARELIAPSPGARRSDWSACTSASFC